MRCPHCKNKLLQKSGSKTRLRTEGIHEWDANGICTAKCFRCKQPVEIPIMIKPEAQVDNVQFILGKAGSSP